MRRCFSIALLLFAACARGEITLPTQNAVDLVTLDASTSWVYLDLASGTSVPQTSAATSTTWDIGFNATNVVLNGGANGPAGVAGYCVCQNATASNDQILMFSTDNQDAAFESVSSSAIPGSNTAWIPDVFTTNSWYRSNIAGDGRISPTFDVYLVKRDDDIYKLQVVSYYGPAGEARRISVRYSKVS